MLGQLPTGMVAITAHDDEPVGVAVGSFGSVSLEPPLVGFFIDRDSSTWPRIERAGAFAANVLGDHQRELCARFAVKDADRFADLDWSAGYRGAPLIDGALAWIECEIADVIELGDHFLAVGAVWHVRRATEGSPLVFFCGGLHTLGRAAEIVAG